MTETFASGEQAVLVLIAALLFSILAGVAIGLALANLTAPPYRKENNTPMKNLWTRIKNAIIRLFKSEQLFLLVWPAITNDTDRKVNNARLQNIAFEAVRVAAAAGLKGGDARTEAFRQCKTLCLSIGVELADRLIDTLIQVAYMRFRDVEG